MLEARHFRINLTVSPPSPNVWPPPLNSSLNRRQKTLRSTMTRSMDTASDAFPPHRANLLNPSYNVVGLGVVRSGDRLYIVQDFGYALPNYSAAEVKERVAAAVNQRRHQARQHELPRLDLPVADDAACSMAQADKLGTSPFVSLPNASPFSPTPACIRKRCPPERPTPSRAASCTAFQSAPVTDGLTPIPRACTGWCCRWSEVRPA